MYHRISPKISFWFLSNISNSWTEEDNYVEKLWLLGAYKRLSVYKYLNQSNTSRIIEWFYRRLPLNKHSHRANGSRIYGLHRWNVRCITVQWGIYKLRGQTKYYMFYKRSHDILMYMYWYILLLYIRYLIQINLLVWWILKI